MSSNLTEKQLVRMALLEQAVANAELAIWDSAKDQPLLFSTCYKQAEPRLQKRFVTAEAYLAAFKRDMAKKRTVVVETRSA